jgi:hypothetical protein
MMVNSPKGFNNVRPIMTSGKSGNEEAGSGIRNGKPLSEAAKRALAEAEQRREEYRRREAAMPKEIGGRGGNEPGRYGDWEVKGLATDF